MTLKGEWWTSMPGAVPGDHITCNTLLSRCVPKQPRLSLTVDPLLRQEGTHSAVSGADGE